MASPSLPAAGREETQRVVVVVERQADLLEVVLALRPRGRLAHLLDGGQEQADEDGNDGEDDQQLDQRERATSCAQGLSAVHIRFLSGRVWRGEQPCTARARAARGTSAASRQRR